jgi:hypothetical protein
VGGRRDLREEEEVHECCEGKQWEAGGICLRRRRRFMSAVRAVTPGS